MTDPKPVSESTQDHTAAEELEKVEGGLADKDIEKVSGGGDGPYATDDGV